MISYFKSLLYSIFVCSLFAAPLAASEEYDCTVSQVIQDCLVVTEDGSIWMAIDRSYPVKLLDDSFDLTECARFGDCCCVEWLSSDHVSITLDSVQDKMERVTGAKRYVMTNYTRGEEVEVFPFDQLEMLVVESAGLTKEGYVAEFTDGQSIVLIEEELLTDPDMASFFIEHFSNAVGTGDHVVRATYSFATADQRRSEETTMYINLDRDCLIFISVHLEFSSK